MRENHGRRRGSPDFLRAALTEGIRCDGTTKLHRKSGFDLHQLRNSYNSATGVGSAQLAWSLASGAALMPYSFSLR